MTDCDDAGDDLKGMYCEVMMMMTVVLTDSGYVRHRRGRNTDLGGKVAPVCHSVLLQLASQEQLKKKFNQFHNKLYCNIYLQSLACLSLRSIVVSGRGQLNPF